MIRVLVVEDETPIQRDICRKIEQYSDEFKVVARASTGEEAVHLLEQIKIDVAFIDVNIPILNGLEVIRHINQLNPEIIKEMCIRDRLLMFSMMLFQLKRRKTV